MTEISGLLKIFSSKFVQYSSFLIILSIACYKFCLGFFVSWLAGRKDMDRFKWFILGIILGLSALFAVIGSMGAEKLKRKIK